MFSCCRCCCRFWPSLLQHPPSFRALVSTPHKLLVEKSSTQRVVWLRADSRLRPMTLVETAVWCRRGQTSRTWRTAVRIGRVELEESGEMGRRSSRACGEPEAAPLCGFVFIGHFQHRTGGLAGGARNFKASIRKTIRRSEIVHPLITKRSFIYFIY